MPEESVARIRTRLGLLALAIAGGWVPVAIASGETVAVRMADLARGQSWSVEYSLLIGAGWALSLVALPAAGWLSDRAVQRGIDRRVLVGIGAFSMCLAAGLLLLAPSIPWFAAAWLFAQLPTALVVAVSSARLADQAPPGLRGWASGAAGIAPASAILIGALTVLILRQTTGATLLGPAVVGALLVVPSLVLTSPVVTSTETRSNLGRSIRRLSRLLIIVALAFSGVAAGRIYVIPLVQTVAGGSTSQVLAAASTTVLIATTAAVIGSVLVGRILRVPDRARSTFAALSLLAAIPLLGLAVAPNLAFVLGCAAALGLVIGGLNAATYGVYLHTYSSTGEHGQELGLIVAAETVPYVIVPLLAAAPQLITGSPLLPALFTSGAIAAIAAAVVARRWNPVSPRNRTDS